MSANYCIKELYEYLNEGLNHRYVSFVMEA